MYFDYDWIKNYLSDPPSREAAAQLLNECGLECEIVDGGLDIEHTVNRPDAMCHFGLARELSVRHGIGLLPPPRNESVLAPLEGWRIESRDAEECPQYIGLKVEGIRPAPAPPWLRERLHAIGQTSHGLLVDLTNFLLWEMGHPIHAFDAGKIEGRRIRVRFGQPGERLVTLDGREHEAEGLLCIADDRRPIAFAGVMGGKNTEVGSETTELLLELACFRPTSVRRTGKSCRIDSDARHRFERGVDRESMERIMRRFLYLLEKEQPWVRVAGVHHMNLQPFERLPLKLRRDRLERLLGISLPDQRVAALLERMDFRPSPVAEGWDVTVPGYKVDVSREIDIIEEVIRFAGLDLLQSELPEFKGTDFKPDPMRDRQQNLRRLLKGGGIQEACTYSFLAEPWDRDFTPAGEPLRLRNPMSENQAVMRRLLLPNLVDCVRKNINRGLANLSFYEIGRVFHGEEEPYHLAIVIAESKEKSGWWQVPSVHPFYRVKGFFELMVERMGWLGLELKAPPPEYLNQTEGLGIFLNGNRIGGLGTLLSKLARKWEIEAPLAVLELDLSFLENPVRSASGVEVLSPYPFIQIDMAFVLDSGHPYQRVKEHLLGMELPQLVYLDMFDYYAGKSIEKGKKSLGFRFRFQAPDQTLTSEMVSRTMDRVVESVKKTFAAIIRI